LSDTLPADAEFRHLFEIGRAVMTRSSGHGRGAWLRRAFGLCCGLVWLYLPTTTQAICGLDAAAFEQIRDVEDPDATQAWALQNVPATSPEDVTVEQAQKLVQKVEAEFRFGILQLSRTHEVSPEEAAALAEFRGEMLILGLRSLSPEVARAIAKSRAATVWLHSVTAVAPEAAEAIAGLSGHLVLSGLVELDSVPLAEKFARQSSRTLDGLEFISAEAIPACVKYKGFFTLRQLTVLDSPELAARLIQDSTGQVLPSLRTISPAAAEVLVTSPNEITLGLTWLADPRVALSLRKSQNGVRLPQLRAATPTVVKILGSSDSITMPPPESIYVLPKSQPAGDQGRAGDFPLSP
jgi:hypothetical protein